MKDALKIGLGIIIGVLGLVACSICAFFVLGTALLTPLPSPTLTPVGIVPARPESTATPPSSRQHPGDSVMYGSIRVTLTAYDFSGSYQTGYREEQPPEGAQFLWLHVRVENIGQNAEDAPYSYYFSILHKGKQTDADSLVLAERPGHERLEGGEIFPGVTTEGWIRFTVPLAAQPEDISVLFYPDLFRFEEPFIWVLIP